MRSANIAAGIALAAASCQSREPRDARAIPTTDVVVERPRAPENDAPLFIAITKEGIEFDAKRVVELEPNPTDGAGPVYKRNGPDDLYVVPLHGALLAAQQSGRLARHTSDAQARLEIRVHPDTPYRVLFEVLYTAGQTELSRFDLRDSVSTGDTIATELPAVPGPGATPAPATDPATLDLTAIVTLEGVAFKTSHGNIAAGCGGIGAGVTVPRFDYEIESQKVGDCARRLRARYKVAATDNTFVLVANKDTPFRDVFRAVRAMRGSKEAPMFTQVRFGVAR
ncbi:MAG: hypothetical protein HOW73_20000 [Polyangiaceae bacterium]|nr:hypothetical protein [Polyangiaceae bacterium]